MWRHKPFGASPEMPWSTPFEDPILLRGGRQLTTLQHAADYIMKLPKDIQQQEGWQIAVENLDQRRGDRRRMADVRADRDATGDERETPRWLKSRAVAELIH